MAVDGHPAFDGTDAGYRILLTAQTTNSENGIYLLTWDGVDLTASRAEDSDTYQELVGAAVYIMEGTTYGATSWVQGNHYLTDFTGQTWTQFSGQGSVTAGSGITVNGLEVSIDRTTVDDWYDAAGSAATAQSNAEDYADGLASNYDPAGSAATAQSNAEDYADGLASNYDPAGAAATAQSNAEDYADGLASNYDAAGSASSAQTAAEGYADGLVDDLLDATTPFTAINVNDQAKQIAATSSSLGSVPVTSYEWPKADYRSGKFLVKIDNGTHNEISEILVTLDSSDNIAITEYAIVGTNGSRGAITADISGSNVRIRVNPVNDSTIKVSGTLLV